MLPKHCTVIAGWNTKIKVIFWLKLITVNSLPNNEILINSPHFGRDQTTNSENSQKFKLFLVCWRPLTKYNMLEQSSVWNVTPTSEEIGIKSLYLLTSLIWELAPELMNWPLLKSLKFEIIITNMMCGANFGSDWKILSWVSWNSLICLKCPAPSFPHQHCHSLHESHIQTILLITFVSNVK